MSHQLNQSDIWVNREGLPIRIDMMSGEYALKAYRFMERNAVQVALNYSAYLHTLNLPDPDTAAYDTVEADISHEIDRMQADVIGWLRDKPLMKALLNRAPAGDPRVGGRMTLALPLTPDPYELPEFKQAEPASKVPATVCQPGDESLVFLVSTGSMEDYEIKAIFVGNRRAALQFAAEHDRYVSEYAKASIEEWADNSITGDGFREYPEPFTEITYRTKLDLDTGAVMDDWRPVFVTRQGMSSPITTEKTHIKRHRLQGDRVEIVTTGPEYQLFNVKNAHRTAVVTTMTNIVEDVNKGDE